MNRTALMFLVAVSGFSGAACQSAIAPSARGPAAQVPDDMAAPGCVRIQRGVRGDVVDTRIAARWPDATYGDQSVAFAGRAGGDRHMLVGFDMGSIPKNAVVSRAVLTLHRTGGMGSEVAVHRVTQPWREHTATFRALEPAWDRAPESTGQLPKDQCSGAVSVDITAAVRGWVGGAPNHGVLLSADESVTFATSESPSAPDRPRLEVCFSLPGA